MTSFADLIEDVRQQLLAYVQDEEQFVTLTQAIGTTETEFLVDDIDVVSSGVIEIGDELILVKNVDRTAGTVMARRRGWSGTTPASHSVNDLVRLHPVIPRVQLKKHINNTIQGTFPDLWVKGIETITYEATKQMYELPADVGEILSVKYSIIGPSDWWQPAQSWELDSTANVESGVNGVFPSGKALWLGDRPIPGQKLQVVYSAAPGALSADSDTLESTSGLPASTHDVIVFGATARAIPALEAGRLQMSSIEASNKSETVQPGDAANASRYFYGLYRARLQEEALKLQRLNPAQSRYTF